MTLHLEKKENEELIATIYSESGQLSYITLYASNPAYDIPHFSHSPLASGIAQLSDGKKKQQFAAGEPLSALCSMSWQALRM